MRKTITMARCYMCKKPLTDPVSVRLGIGPVCRMKRKEDMKRDLFCFAADYTWGIDGEIIWIKDNSNGSRTVTNDSENVICEIAAELHEPITNFAIMYRDTESVWDEIKILSVGSDIQLKADAKMLEQRRETGRQYFSSWARISFQALTETDYQKAKHKLLHRHNQLA